MTRAATDEQGWTIWAEPTNNRRCGDCQLCCTLIPVELSPTEKKPAAEKCRHQCSRGCAIYERRPDPCRWWSCRWLFDPLTAAMGLKRPDHGGYVVDSARDKILANGEPVDVMQVWIDPKRPEAHRDPALRRYIAAIAETYGIPTIIRFSQTDGMVLFAPCLTDDGEWIEHYGEPITEDEIAEKLNALGVNRFG